MLRVRDCRRVAFAATAGGLLGLVCTIGQGQETPPQPVAEPNQNASSDLSSAGPQMDAEAQAEVQTRGIVHEAFAEPLASDLTEGLVISQSPPEPIDELPPEFMPEGDNVEWIPGYWGWDDDVEDFLWVSGLWRNVPPNQRWVPGYWASVDDGYRWVSGFWTDAGVNDLEYLPYPPPSQEHGPNSAAPGSDYFWVPGSWVYVSNDYRWQPGYWAPAHDDWCWTPQRYTWTPRGVLYSPGFWDYRIPNRGTLFAPVRFGNPGYFRGARRFTPNYVINPAGLLVNLFVRPQYRHYYFGDYYGRQYTSRGFRPWFDTSYNGAYYYDPLLAFYESYYDRRGVDFSGRMNRWYDYYDQNPNRRPPRTLQRTLRSAVPSDGDVDTSQLILARAINELADGDLDGQGRWRFRNLSSNQRSALADASVSFRDVVRNRGRAEIGVATSSERDRQQGRSQPGEPIERAERNQQTGDRPGRTDDGPSQRRLQLPKITRQTRNLPGSEAGGGSAEAIERQRERLSQKVPDAADVLQRRVDRDRSQRLERLRPPTQPQPNSPTLKGLQQDKDLQQQLRRGADGGPDLRRGTDAVRGLDNSANRRQNQIERQAPTRNMFQPRRGNFSEQLRGNQQASPQRSPVDPREAIPSFGGNRGRGNGLRGGLNRTPNLGTVGGVPGIGGRSRGESRGRGGDN